MKSFAFAALVSAVCASDEFEFMSYLTKWNKSYGTRDEFNFRLTKFLESDSKIKALNAEEGRTSVHGHNQFSDWTHDEYKRLLGGYLTIEDDYEATVTFDEEEQASNAWYYIDWRQYGVVNPVQD